MQRHFSEKHIIIILCLIILLYMYISSIDNVGIIILSIPILLILLDIFVFKSPKIEASGKKDIIEEEKIEPEKEDINSEENSEEIRHLIKDVVREFHVTCIYVSHNINDCISLADKVFVMNEGKIIMACSPIEFLESDDKIVMSLKMDLPHEKES